MYLRTIYSGKERGIANRGHFLTCERVEEDSKQEQDARMTTSFRAFFIFFVQNIQKCTFLRCFFRCFLGVGFSFAHPEQG